MRIIQDKAEGSKFRNYDPSDGVKLWPVAKCANSGLNILSCIRRRRGHFVSIKLVMRHLPGE